MDLPFKTHFGIDCKACGTGCFVEVTREQASLDDPVSVLRSLNQKDQTEIAEFFSKHKAHGAIPALVGLAEIPKA